jgi:carbon starvation protein CstA
VENDYAAVLWGLVATLAIVGFGCKASPGVRIPILMFVSMREEGRSIADMARRSLGGLATTSVFVITAFMFSRVGRSPSSKIRSSTLSWRLA